LLPNAAVGRAQVEIRRPPGPLSGQGEFLVPGGLDLGFIYLDKDASVDFGWNSAPVPEKAEAVNGNRENDDAGENRQEEKEKIPFCPNLTAHPFPPGKESFPLA